MSNNKYRSKNEFIVLNYEVLKLKERSKNFYSIEISGTCR